MRPPGITHRGVAYSARRLGVRSLIVMPRTTPEIKVSAVREMGAEVVLEGDDYPAAQAHCDEMAPNSGLTFIHAFDLDRLGYRYTVPSESPAFALFLGN